jgi:hypothetical protein
MRVNEWDHTQVRRAAELAIRLIPQLSTQDWVWLPGIETKICRSGGRSWEDTEFKHHVELDGYYETEVEGIYLFNSQNQFAGDDWFSKICPSFARESFGRSYETYTAPEAYQIERLVGLEFKTLKNVQDPAVNFYRRININGQAFRIKFWDAVKREIMELLLPQHPQGIGICELCQQMVMETRRLQTIAWNAPPAVRQEKKVRIKD